MTLVSLRLAGARDAPAVAPAAERPPAGAAADAEAHGDAPVPAAAAPHAGVCRTKYGKKKVSH